MNAADYPLFMRGLDSIGEPPAPRYYPESDGEPNARTFYVLHSRTAERTECRSWKEAVTLAKQLNSKTI